MNDGQEQWTEEDDAAAIAEGLPDWHPSLFVSHFRTALRLEHPGVDRVLATAFVTPESVESWGGFSGARAWAGSDSKISTAAIHARDASDVAYVRLVFTDKWITPNLDTPEHAIATLVWRPEIAVLPHIGWRIHRIGEAADPRSLPRTAIGFDPRR